MISVSVAPALNYSSFLFVSCIWTNLYCLWKQASWTCHLQTQAIESELERGLQIAVCGWRGARVTYPVFPLWISWSPQPQHSCICHTCLCFQNPKRNSSKWSQASSERNLQKKKMVHEWPSQLPDLTPNENLWKNLRAAMDPSGFADFLVFVEEWAKITLKECIWVEDRRDRWRQMSPVWSCPQQRLFLQSIKYISVFSHFSLSFLIITQNVIYGHLCIFACVDWIGYQVRIMPIPLEIDLLTKLITFFICLICYGIIHG